MQIIIVCQREHRRNEASAAVLEANWQPSALTLCELGHVIEVIRATSCRGEHVGVLSDVRFPIGGGGRFELDEGCSDFPSGLMLMAECKSLGFPCVLVGDDNTRSDNDAHIDQALRAVLWQPIIPYIPGNGEGSWKLAMQYLRCSEKNRPVLTVVG